MKKLITVLALFSVIALCLCGCSNDSGTLSSNNVVNNSSNNSSINDDINSMISSDMNSVLSDSSSGNAVS